MFSQYCFEEQRMYTLPFFHRLSVLQLLPSLNSHVENRTIGCSTQNLLMYTTLTLLALCPKFAVFNLHAS